MASKYNASHFLKKFKAIPDEDWTTGAFSKRGRHCALGHLGAPVLNYTEVMALVRLFSKYLDTKPAQVNDGDDLRFRSESGPKRRVLKALRMIKNLRTEGYRS